MIKYHSPNRRHSKELFYKYMSASVAKIALTNQTLRWSAPPLFNDPFDVPRILAAGIDFKEVQDSLIEQVINIIDGRAEIPSVMRPEILLLIERLRHSKSAVTKVKVVKILKQMTDDLFLDSNPFSKLKTIWEKLIPNLRILCLSTCKDSASMWNHYADQYKGVVLELACIDELDSPWLAAKQVEYPKDRPSLFTKEGWAKLLILNKDEAGMYILNEYCYTKTYDWRYEDEWRVVSFKRPGEDGLHFDYTVDPRHFNAIYFGSEISDDDRDDLLELLKFDLSHMSAYQGKVSHSRSFEFDKIEKNKV